MSTVIKMYTVIYTHIKVMSEHWCRLSKTGRSFFLIRRFFITCNFGLEAPLLGPGQHICHLTWLHRCSRCEFFVWYAYKQLVPY